LEIRKKAIQRLVAAEMLDGSSVGLQCSLVHTSAEGRMLCFVSVCLSAAVCRTVTKKFWWNFWNVTQKQQSTRFLATSGSKKFLKESLT